MWGNTAVVVNLIQVTRLGIQEINSSLECFTMKIKFVAAFFTALCASLAVPAFASGYGPTPFYRASEGAPASQRGQSTATLATERSNAADTQHGYGGTTARSSQSGRLVAVMPRGDVHASH